MKIQRTIAFLLSFSVLLPALMMTGLAAENPGITVTASADTVKAGEAVTVTVSLTDYDENTDPIRGIQIDINVKEVSDSLLSIEEGGYVSLIQDNAARNTAVYLEDEGILRLIYFKEDGALSQPSEDIFEFTVLFDTTLQEAGSISLPVSAKIQTVENRIVVEDQLPLAYLPGDTTVEQYIDWYQASLILEDAVAVDYYMTLDKTVFSGFVPTAENSGLQVWTAEDYAALNLAADEYPALNAVPSKTYKGFTDNGNGLYDIVTDGIPAKEMGDTMHVRAYAIDNRGVKHFTRMTYYSPKVYAQFMLNDSDQKLVALVKALMNYGAAAQLNFNYRTDDLMNNILPEADRVINYNASMLVPLKDYVTSKYAFTENPGINAEKAAPVLEDKVAINTYYKLPSALKAAATKVELMYWHEDAYAAAKTLSADNCTAIVPMIDEGTYYCGTIAGTPAKDLGNSYFFCVRVTTENEVYYSKMSRYSVHYYVRWATENEADDVNLNKLCEAMAVYSHDAKIYFAK